jgi:2-oxoglutarate ferredoxin oxidoreductase subunit alpha
MRDSVTWKIAGEAGFGIMSSGIMLARAFTRTGYHVFGINDYPSLIRGGHNVITVRVGTAPFHGVTRDVHILVALNAETVTMHANELGDGSLVVYDPADHDWTPADFPKKVTLVPVPFKEIVTTLKADSIMRNTIALGASIALLGAPFDSLATVIHDQFIKKGQELVDQDTKIAKAGYDYIKEHFPGETTMALGPGTYKEKLAVLNGSEAVGLGAVRAGLKFAAIYPMTPINSVISFLADHAKELQVVYKQPEDEIAGINMAIGASIAGVRSMVATSGGGFALMVEGLSLAGMVEAPLVIDLGMRVGPATGMPTYTEQGELLFAIHAGHGEFPRIILAPGDIQEAFELTIAAFQLADKYQVPVFVMTDKYLNESHWTLPVAVLQKPVVIDRGKFITGDTGKADGEFLRYDATPTDGVSPRVAIGTKHGQYYANSYEHDGHGHMTEDAGKRRAMVEKRARKVVAMHADMIQPVVTGDENPDLTLVAWGTTKGVAIAAMETLRKQGKKVAVVTFPWVYPFPKEAATKLLSKGRVVIIEQNVSGQLATLIRTETGIDITEKILKYDGRPFVPEEIVERLGA